MRNDVRNFVFAFTHIFYVGVGLSIYQLEIDMLETFENHLRPTHCRPFQVIPIGEKWG
jgi:hypothetical protein